MILAQSYSASGVTWPRTVKSGQAEDRVAKMWEWQVQESKGHLNHQRNNRVVVYRHIRRGRYKRLRTSQSGRMRGEEVSAEKFMPGVWKVCLVATHTNCPEPPSNFINVLKD